MVSSLLSRMERVRHVQSLQSNDRGRSDARSVSCTRQPRGQLESDELYPDRMAPIVTGDGDTHVLRKARWGLPSPPLVHSRSGIDRGVTNVRNTGSPHWRRWLGPLNRCLVPLDRFAETRAGKGAGNAWFRRVDDRPAFFAGLWVPGWTSIRKLKDGETTDDLYAFLTCEPNAVLAAVHPKAMPVILTEVAEIEAWLSTPWSEAMALQRPLQDSLLRLAEEL
jgi:putative SOS response-associated peptidase YedK